MATFVYQAKDQKGQIVTGTVEAESEASASQILWENKLKVLTIQPKPVVGTIGLFGRVSVIHKAFFARQLATLISAGLPLAESLRICYTQTKNKRLKEALELVAKDIEEGLTLAAALSKHPDVFDEIFISVVKAGEISGKLTESLISIAERLEKDSRFRAKVISAMIYPIFVLCAIFVVGAIVMIKIIPPIKSIFEGAHVKLPWTTRMIIGMSEVLAKGWWALIVGFIAVFLAVRAYIKTENGRRWWSNFILAIPIYGNLSKSLLLTRFLRTFTLLSKTGIPLIDALHLLTRVVDNNLYQLALYRVAADVERGIPLSVPLASEKIFPSIISEMVKVGEQSGKLDEMLERLGNYYEEQVTDQTSRIGEIIEPVIIVILGIGVGILFAGVIMPIYQMAQLM